MGREEGKGKGGGEKTSRAEAGITCWTNKPKRGQTGGNAYGRNPSSRVMRSPDFIGAQDQVKSESRFLVLYSQGKARRIRAKALQAASLRTYVMGGAALLPRVLCLVSSHSYCWNASVREGARAPTWTTKRKPSTGGSRCTADDLPTEGAADSRQAPQNDYFCGKLIFSFCVL